MPKVVRKCTESVSHNSRYLHSKGLMRMRSVIQKIYPKTIFRTLQDFYKSYPIAVVLLFSLSIISALVWGHAPHSEWRSFGLNMFTELLGVILTLLAIDFSSKRRLQEEKLPLRIIAYNDICNFVNSNLNFWKDLFEESVPNSVPLPSSFEEFMKIETFAEISKYLDLESKKTNILPEQILWDYIPNRIKGHRDKAEKVLDKYLLALPLKSELASQLAECAESIEQLGKFLVTTASMQNTIMAGKVWSRPQQMPFQDILKDKYFPTMLSIYRFCQEEQQELQTLGCENLTSISKINDWERFSIPPSMIHIP
ncbi:MAG: hypothetical protein MUF71_17610 [Candidatus Kapabacteria bacterium]|nr:hypothetical protein [Candidatus Kapabacteria bacterium]